MLLWTQLRYFINLKFLYPSSSTAINKLSHCSEVYSSCCPDFLDQVLVCASEKRLHFSMWSCTVSIHIFDCFIKSQFCCIQRQVWKNMLMFTYSHGSGLALVSKQSPNWKVQQQPECRLTASSSFLLSWQMPEAGTLLRTPIITSATTEGSRHFLMIEEMLTEGGEMINLKSISLYIDTLTSNH